MFAEAYVPESEGFSSNQKDVARYFQLADAKEGMDDRLTHYRDLKDGFDELFYEKGFSEPDVILLQGGPDKYEESQRFEAFEDIMQEVENRPVLKITENYLEMVETSDRVDSQDVHYRGFDPGSTVEEVESLSDLSDARVISVTNDYHVPRTERILDRYLDDSVDYLVAGAEFDPVESEYGEKWRSEAVRTAIPQDLKGLGKTALSVLR